MNEQCAAYLVLKQTEKHNGEYQKTKVVPSSLYEPGTCCDRLIRHSRAFTTFSETVIFLKVCLVYYWAS